MVVGQSPQALLAQEAVETEIEVDVIVAVVVVPGRV